MARARSPDRDKAFEIWKNSNGTIKLKDIAAELNLPDSRIRKWKAEDNWEEKVKGTFPLQKRNAPKKKDAKSNGNAPKKCGAPLGSKNALGNSGGSPPGNTRALKHGFFAKIFPDDPETKAIIESIDIMSPIEMLWQNIVIQYTAIARAQRIMFVQDKEDQTKVLVKQKESDGDTSSSWEKQWEIQHAWDKQASFMQAQSRAMTTLQGMITRYDEMMQKDLTTEEQRLRIEKLKAEIHKLNGDSLNAEDTPKFIDDIGTADGD